MQMETSHTKVRMRVSQPSLFLSLWLLLFASSYITHSARALAAVSSAHCQSDYSSDGIGSFLVAIMRRGAPLSPSTALPTNSIILASMVYYIAQSIILFLLFYLVFVHFDISDRDDTQVILRPINDGESTLESETAVRISNREAETQTEEVYPGYAFQEQSLEGEDSRQNRNQRAETQTEDFNPDYVSQGQASESEKPKQISNREAETQTEEIDPGYVSQDQGSEKPGDNRMTAGADTQNAKTPRDDRAPPSSPEYQYDINESDFDEIGLWLRLSVDTCDTVELRRGLDSNFKYHCVNGSSLKILGYIISQNDATMLRECVRWMKEKFFFTFLLKTQFWNKYHYTEFAVERRLDKIITVLYDLFPKDTENAVYGFASRAAEEGNLARFELAWRVMRNHEHFLRVNLWRLVSPPRLDFICFICRSPKARCATGFDLALVDAIHGREYEIIRHFCQVPTVDPRKPIPFGANPSPGEPGKYSALSRAISQGDTEILTMLLDKDKLFRPGQGVMPGLLEKALWLRKYKIAELLLARGANILEVRLDTAMEIMGEEKWKGTLRILLKAGRRDFESRFYGSVLQAACVKRDIETAKLLLEYGHSINPKSPMAFGGNSPLMAAIGGGDELVNFLISKGASIGDARGTFGTAFQTVVSLGLNWALPIILRYTDRDELDAVLPWPIGWSMGSSERSRFNNRSLQTPLEFAVDLRDAKLAKILLEAGASRYLLSVDYSNRLEGMLVS